MSNLWCPWFVALFAWLLNFWILNFSVQAVILFHMRQYAKSLSILEPLYRNIEPIEEVVFGLGCASPRNCCKHVVLKL